jgi:hypothetical protein
MVHVNYDEALQRLRNHANLPGSGPDNESLGLAVWYISRERPTLEVLARLFDDVVQCLECVNLALNGPVPSETPNSHKQLHVDRWLAYAVASLLDILIKSLNRDLGPQQYDIILSMTKSVSIAWTCVLAGDVDQLATHVNLL